MEVTLKIKEWEVKRDEKASVIAGKYELMMGTTSIATEAFNDGYNEKKIPFSGDLMNEIAVINKKIEAEIEKALC